MVVSGLVPGENYNEGKAYRHKIRAESIQGISDQSDEVETMVVNEQSNTAAGGLHFSSA